MGSGSVAVPLDANLPDKDLCELIDRADVTTLIYDEAKSRQVAFSAKFRCVSITPLLFPVVPDVNIIVASSSGFGI